MMDANNLGPNQPAGQNLAHPNDWRAQLQPGARQRIVDRIMETLTRLPNSKSEEIDALRIVACKYEEKIYAAATNQSEYLRKISAKMNLIASEYQKIMDFSSPSIRSVQTRQSSDSVTQELNQTQPCPMDDSPRSTIQSLVGQSSNIQHITGCLQNSIDGSMGQARSSDVLANNLRQMQVMSEVLPRQQHPNWLHSTVQQTPAVMRPRLMQSAQQAPQFMQLHSDNILHQQNNRPSLLQQQVMIHQNNLSNIHQQQCGSHSNASGLPPQQRQESLEYQAGNFNIQGNQHSVHMPSRPEIFQQQQMQLFHQQSSSQQPFNSSHQSQPIAHQRKPLHLSQRALPENSSTQTGNAGGGDWQEDVYQRIETCKKMYLTQLAAIHHRLATKLKQLDSLPQQPRSEELEKVKKCKMSLESVIAFISVPRSGISRTHKEKLSTYENYIEWVLNSTRRPRQQQGQQPAPPPSRQVYSLQQLKNEYNSPSPLPGVSTSQPSMLNSLSKVEPGQEDAICSSQKVSSPSIPQNIVPDWQLLQPSTRSVHSQYSMLHQQHLKHQQEQRHLLHNQELGSRHIQQRLMQKKLLMMRQRNLLYQTKQQIQMPHLYQPNVKNDTRMRQGLNMNSGGGQLPISFSQLSQAANPQLPQHSSRQLDQLNFPPVTTKIGIPPQPTSLPLVGSSPITSLASSAVPEDPDKPIATTSSPPNATNNGHPETTGAEVASKSLLQDTVVESVSLQPEQLQSLEDTQANTQATVPAQAVAKEQPIDRLIRAVETSSSLSLVSSVRDIASVLSLMDRIAESEQGEGSRASVGEDLVTMTKCRFPEKSFSAQDRTDRAAKKMKRNNSVIPVDTRSSLDSIGDIFQPLSTPIEPKQALLEEIKAINRRLIDTVVEIRDDNTYPSALATGGGEGTIVNCCFGAVSLSPCLKSHLASANMLPIQPLCLLVPTNYPNCSPVFLDKFSDEIVKDKEDLFGRSKLRFGVSFVTLEEPISLKDIARTWDACVREVLTEYAKQFGGGTFSSKYGGSWENC